MKRIEKLCDVLIEKIENLEFVNKYQANKIKQLEEENEKLKNQKQAVTDFVDRTQASIEKRTLKGG